jgi:hypothetical protein
MILAEGIDFYGTGPQHPNLCANCHNPHEALLYILDTEYASDWSIQEALGNPYQEWLQGEYSQEGENYRTCLDCHGQNGTGTVHRWPEDKAELVRAAYGELEIITSDVDDPSNENAWEGGIRITNVGAGHMFPTGDPGRMVTIYLNVYADDDLYAEAVYSFGSVESEDGGLLDTRLAPGESHDLLVTLSEPPVPADQLVLKWRVTYEFDPAFASILERWGVEPDVLVIEDNL